MNSDYAIMNTNVNLSYYKQCMVSMDSSICLFECQIFMLLLPIQIIICVTAIQNNFLMILLLDKKK